MKNSKPPKESSWEEAKIDDDFAPLPPDHPLNVARDETRRILVLEPSRIADPTLPIYRYQAGLDFVTLGERFSKGDRGALFSAIRVASVHGLPLPAWAAEAFVRGYNQVLNCRIDSWDEAFGKPFRKGAHLSALRKKRESRMAVLLAVQEAIENDETICSELFERVGRPLGLGKTLTEEFYYEALKLFPYMGKRPTIPSPKPLPRKRKK